MGIATQFTFIGISHLLFMSQIRDYNKVMRIFITVVFCTLILVLIIGHGFPHGSPHFYRRVFEVLTLPLFWLTLPAALTLMFIPYYCERVYW